jgi:hypothetical protein
MRSLSSRIIVAGGAGSGKGCPIPSRWRDVEYVFSRPPAKPEDDDPDPPIFRESQYQEYLELGLLRERLFNVHAKWTYNISPSSNNGGGVMTMPFTNYSKVTYAGQDVGYSFGIQNFRTNIHSYFIFTTII